MIEVDFKDRVPLNPNRIELTPVNGMENTYEMIRADNPIVGGTPLNKATFDSMTRSRLTGRYYPLNVSSEITATQTQTTSPYANKSWTVDSAGLVATSGAYRLTASSRSTTDYTVEKAVDSSTTTQWSSADGTLHTYTLYFPIAIMLKKFKMQLGRTGNFTYMFTVQGSNNGTEWIDLYITNTFNTNMTEYTLTKTGDYMYYRFKFVWGGSARIYINDLQLTEWAANSYSYKYTADRVPLQWDKGQRITVQTPVMSLTAVSGNTFMGYVCNTILQPNKRYELVYNGNSFDAKEL